MELLSSVQSNENIVNTSQKLLKTRCWGFPEILRFFLNILSMALVIRS